MERIAHPSQGLPSDSQLHYVIDVATTPAGGGLAVNILLRKLKKDGEWGLGRSRALSRMQIEHLFEPADRQIAAMLLGANTQPFHYYGYYEERTSTFQVNGPS